MRGNMNVTLHPHAQRRLKERGASHSEVVATVLEGEPIPAKLGRSGFRRNFPFAGSWRGKAYTTKQVEVFAVREGEDWLVITVVTRFS